MPVAIGTRSSRGQPDAGFAGMSSEITGPDATARRRLAGARITLLPPQGYLEMLGLIGQARLVLTDSGGIQEETTALAVACLTMRENTERPITVEQGTNTLVGRNRARTLDCVDEILRNGGKRGRTPELWDGHAAERIADDLSAWLGLSALDRKVVHA